MQNQFRRPAVAVGHKGDLRVEIFKRPGDVEHVPIFPLEPASGLELFLGAGYRSLLRGLGT